MNFNLASYYIFKIIGGLSLTYGLIGIVLALFSVLSLENLETMDIKQALTDHDLNEKIDLSNREMQEALSKLPEIVVSNEFSEFYWSMAAFCLITNILLIYIGYQLLKKRHIFAWWYIVIMAVSYSYLHGVPSLISPEENQALAFGAAWGIGNMGVSLLLYTHFWFWGPLLVFIGLITHYHKP